MKRLILVCLLIIMGGCSQPAKSDDLTIVTSFYPLYDFARILAQDEATVVNIMGSGASAHDFEPSIQDRVTLESADIFVYNGAGMEEWVDKTLESMDASLVVVDTSKSVETMKKGTEVDPHIWLDPVNAIGQVTAIYDALVSVDPDNKDLYTKRYDALVAELKALDQEMTEGMKTAKHPLVLMNHRAFSYMANRYGFTIESISGIIPDIEPTPAQLTEVIEIIKEHDIHTILMEASSNVKVTEAIQQEVDVDVLFIDTLEAVGDDGDSYVNIMRKNIENLLIAMN